MLSVIQHFNKNIVRWKKEAALMKQQLELQEETNRYKVAKNNRSLLKH